MSKATLTLPGGEALDLYFLRGKYDLNDLVTDANNVPVRARARDIGNKPTITITWLEGLC
jgi:hypothetical protein